MTRKLIAFTCALALGALTACSGTTSGITDPAPRSTKPSANSLLQQVRAAGQMGNELDVQPLRDPQVEDLRSVATQAEGRGDFAAARKALAQALLLSPDDPDLLQWQAEMSLVGRDWAQAAQLANRSFDKGPKLGGLCRRNWTTLRFAAEARGDTAAASLAQQRVATCTVAPPTRM